MALILLFAFILLIVFGLMMFLTRPTRTEKLVQSRLETAAGRARTQSIEHVDILKRETLSEVPWLNQILTKLQPAAKIRKLISDAGVTWSVGRLISGSLLAAIVVYLAGRLLIPNPVIGPIFTVAAFVAPYLFLIFKRGKRLQKFGMQLPDAMDLISRALRAGHSLTAAMDLVAQEIADPLGPEFRRVFDEQNLGLPQREALLNLAERIPLADVQFLVASILIQRESGGNLVEVLDKTATVLRDRIRLQRQIRVFTAQGRLTGWILSLLPVVMFLLLSALNPHYMGTLTTEPAGQKLVIAGVVLMLMGGLVIRKIIRIKV